MSVGRTIPTNPPRRLPLAKLNFGKIDARNEVLTRDKKVIDHFRESFLEPANVSIDEFTSGERFFIHGSKGAGKTAFLRYIQLGAEAESCFTRFITFSSEISEEERIRIGSIANIELIEQDGDPGSSAVNAWIMFIFRELSRTIIDHRRTFDSNRNINYFVDLTAKFYEGEKRGFLSWLLETAKRGKYKVHAKFLEGNLSGQAGEAEREVPIDVIVRQCFSLLRDLSWEGPPKIYIFFDELNLSFGSRVQHKRDAVLIRDLILAIDRVNAFFIEKQISVFVLAAARSEVLFAVSVPTLEINKILNDRGRELRWFSKTATEDSPISALFSKKVNASEKVSGYLQTINVFDSYFRKNTFGMRAQDLIVELTWCNPRDLILLFGEACKGDVGHQFDEPTISRALEKYSAEAWSEKVEELNVEYAATELQSLRKILLDFSKFFKMDEFERRKQNKAEMDQHISQFHSRRTSSKILEDLYRIGVIGQSTRSPVDRGMRVKQFEEHWAYRGNHSFDPAAWMIVHKAFWPFLRLGPIWANR